MKISLNWLNEFVSVPWPAEKLAEKLTQIGLETESIETIKCSEDKILIGQIETIEKHPQADKLTVCRVDVGREKLQIVCGAKNMKPGDKIPVAVVGATLPGDFKIKKSQLRGIDSFGMMCSAKELSFAEESDGLLILPEDFPVGKPISDFFPVEDAILEISITPNRGDCLSHIGIAREIAVLTGKTIKLPDIQLTESKQEANKFFSVMIKDKDCLRYTARVIHNVQIQPSPLKMQVRLFRCGIRPINNIVDVTNYCLLETGQPLHAFDLKKLKANKIEVRSAKKGESFVTLDDSKLKLNNEDLLITDSKEAIALAGVMGGKETEVDENTESVLLESAYFTPSRVRKTSRHYNLISESSYRFERGVDIENVAFTSKRAAKLIQDLTGAEILKGMVDAYPKKWSPPRIRLQISRIAKLLGCQIPKKEVISTLKKLNIEIKEKGGDAMDTTIPPYRHDLTREVDLIEEIVRFFGINQVPTTHSVCELKPYPIQPLLEIEARLNQTALGLGFNQVINYSFVSKKDLVPYFVQEKELSQKVNVLKNPLTEEHKYMRPRLLPSLLRTVQYNQARGIQEVRIYESGSTYPFVQKGKKSAEMKSFTLVMTPPEAKVNWKENGLNIDFYYIKGISESLLNALNIMDLTLRSSKDPAYHPGQSGEWIVNNEVIAQFGQIHPLAIKHFSIETAVFAVEFFLDKVPYIREKVNKIKPIPKYPKVSRDIALILPEEMKEELVSNIFKQLKSPLLENFSLFDVYQGPQVPKGMKSLAYSLHYRSQDDTLTDKQVESEHQKVCQTLKNKLGCEFRS